MGVDENEAVLQAAHAYHINPHQVKKSIKADEVDVFIPKDVWDSLSVMERGKIEQDLIKIFNPKDSPDYYPKLEVDFYKI